MPRRDRRRMPLLERRQCRRSGAAARGWWISFSGHLKLVVNEDKTASWVPLDPTIDFDAQCACSKRKLKTAFANAGKTKTATGTATGTGTQPPPSGGIDSPGRARSAGWHPQGLQRVPADPEQDRRRQHGARRRSGTGSDVAGAAHRGQWHARKRQGQARGSQGQSGRLRHHPGRGRKAGAKRSGRGRIASSGNQAGSKRIRSDSRPSCATSPSSSTPVLRCIAPTGIPPC